MEFYQCACILVNRFDSLNHQNKVENQCRQKEISSELRDRQSHAKAKRETEAARGNIDGTDG